MEINALLEKVWPQWKIDKELGEGSFGKVFSISRTDVGGRYEAALKLITIPKMKSEIDDVMSEGMDEDSASTYFKGMMEEIVKEFAMMEKLKGNTNIVAYEDHAVVLHEDGIGWDILIRMELLTPLKDYYSSKKVLQSDVIQLGIDICKALEICKKYKIIHRDIKPENIFVSELGQYKLGDFGVARTAEKTMGNMSVKGTFSFMAPEVYKGQEYGAAVDIYSLGLVLYRLLNDNRVPFLPPAPAPITYSDREVAEGRRMSGEIFPDAKNATPEMMQIIRKATAYRDVDRYADPADMRMALETLQLAIPIAIPGVKIEAEGTVLQEDMNVPVKASKKNPKEPGNVSKQSSEEPVKASAKASKAQSSKVKASKAQTSKAQASKKKMSTGKKVGMIIGIVAGSIAILFAAIIVVAIINVSDAAEPKLKKADLMELGYIDKDSNLLCVLDGTQNYIGEKNITIPSGGYLPQKADWSNTSSGYVCDRDGMTSHSDEMFDPRSFYGNWSLHKITGPGGQYTCDYRMFIESSGAVRELEILPTKMKFSGALSDLYTFKREIRSDADISGANCFEMVFHTNPVDKYENIKEITTYGIYDTASDVLAVGFAKVTDEDHIEFTECDYSISWTGFELVLTIDGISACYIPSSMQSYFASGFDKSRSIMWSGYRKLASGYKPIDGFSEIYLGGSEFIKDKNMPALMIQSNVTYGAPYNTTAYKCGVLFYRDGIVRMHVTAKAGSNYSMPEFYENCSYRMSERAIVLIKGGVESLYVTEY